MAGARRVKWRRVAGRVEIRFGIRWRDTAVLAVSESGRTAAENGSRGTDHGVGALALLLGGAVGGGRLAGAWPGMSRAALCEGRDVRPTTHYESLFKAALIGHIGLSPAVVEDKVFPDGRDLAPAENLFRTG